MKIKLRKILGYILIVIFGLVPAVPLQFFGTKNLFWLEIVFMVIGMVVWVLAEGIFFIWLLIKDELED